jgi:hypothetical protein
METVAKNQSLFTVKQVEAADRARVFSAAMGYASPANVHALVRAGRIEDIDFEHSDVSRATKIYGPQLEALRGKSTQSKTKFADPVVGKVVQSNLIGYADIIFVAGYPFFAMLVKPIMMFFCTLIKSRSTADVKRALDKQISVVQAEGFIITEVTADGEGALGAMKEELERAGCKITIHGKSTHSAEVDNKIRQVKNVMRSCSCWPSLFPTVLTAALVYFAVHKVNMYASRANAHGYSPIEIYLGRPISLWRDLGAKGKGGKPLAFGSRVEIFNKTSNTMADRTRPALFLGSKGTSYGTATFFTLDTRMIVSSDQWKGLPMDAGTIARVNEIARMGPPFPRKIPIYVGGRELSDVDIVEPADDSAMPYGRASFPERVVADKGHDTPDMSFGDQVDNFSLGIEVVRADEAIESRTNFGIAEEQRELADGIGGDTRDDGEAAEIGGGGAAEIGGATSSSGTEPNADMKYHYPALDPTPEDSSRSNPVGAPWFLAGKPLPITEGRSKRVTKAPSRYGFDDKFVTETGLLAEVYSLMRTEQSSRVVKRVPFRPTTGRNRVQQARLENQREKHFSAFILTIDKAVTQLGDKALESMYKELSGLHKKSVFTQVLLRNLSDEQRRKIISSKMFLKEKFFPSGLFDKLKSRLVAGGHMQDRGDYGEEETSSPTVSLTSVYLVTSMAARERRKVGSADVGTAYLNAKMWKDVFMRMDRRVSEMLVKLFPNFYKLDTDGKVYVKLDKALYGCVESAKLWFDEISKALTGLGFVANPQDQCVFNLQRNGHQVTICLYVDDLLITSVDEADIEWVVSELRARYETVTLNSGQVHSYLGQTFDFSTDGEVHVSMDGYVRDILDYCEVTGFSATPATVDLYEINADLPPIDQKAQDEFHSTVMKLMFLAQRARPDILTAVSFLSRRWSKATEEDLGKLTRVLKYLNSYPDIKMVLRCADELRVYSYVDASFAVHSDMKSHTGGIISLGTGSVNVSSKKQQLMTKSSTEAELVGLSDRVPQTIWVRDFMQSQGYALGPAKVFQDNQSTMALVVKGRSTSARTRHVAIRYFFTKDRVDSGELEIVYLPTGEMRADILTKPLQGSLFRKMRDELMGYSVREKPRGEGEASETSRGAKEFGVSEPLVVKV